MASDDIPAHIRVLPWGGDVPQACHGHFASPHRPLPAWPAAVDLRVEVAVVGGGLSGLTAAYHLKDRDCLVLEAAPRPGGVCLGGDYQGIAYPAGSAYFYVPEEESGQAWFRELGLSPEAALVAPPASALFHQGRWYPDCFSPEGILALPVAPPLKGELRRLAAELAELDETWEPLGAPELSRPELDRYSLADYLETVRGFPPDLTRLFSPYCRSCLGAEPEEVSAWAGLYFLMSEFSPASRTGAFPEGNARLITALAGALPRPVRVEQTVVGLQNSADAVQLLVWDARRRRFWRLAARAVILAAGKFVARRLLPSDCGWSLADFQAFRYSSYVVAALCGPLRLEAPGFENWVAGEPAFSDFVLLPRSAPPGAPRVMVIFAPQPFTRGRGLLLPRTPGEQAGEILAAAERLFPGLTADVREIHLYRFGHAQVVPYPGFITRLKTGIPARRGRVILANADMEGLPCIEAAILQGRQAAQEALTVLGE